MHRSNRLHERRKALGLTEHELAVRVGVHAPTISRWATGKQEPSVRHALALAAALETTVEALFADAPARELSA